MQTTASFAVFEATARNQGFDETLVREWAPNAVTPEHTHPFAVQALVVRGELWLSHSGSTQYLTAGSRFALDPDVPHSERYGEAGATFWVARRHKVLPTQAAA